MVWDESGGNAKVIGRARLLLNRSLHLLDSAMFVHC